MATLNEAQTQEMAELLSDYLGESEVSVSDVLGIMENAGITRPQLITLLHKMIANFEDVAWDDPNTAALSRGQADAARRLIEQLRMKEATV